MIPSNQIAVDQNNEIDIVVLCRLMWEYKYLILGITVLCGLVGTYIALTSIPVYRAEVVVTEVREGNMSGGGSVASQLGGLVGLANLDLTGGGGANREAQAVLRSRRLVEEFIERNALLPVILSASERTPTLWSAVQRFREAIFSIRDDTRKGTTTIAIEWTDPQLAAQWANEFIAVANEIVRTRATDDSRRNIAYLNDQIALTSVVELRRVMYNLVEAETKTLMLANARAEYAFAIVDPAVPPEVRSKPRRKVIVMVSLVLGLLGGAAVAFSHNALAWRRRSVVPNP